MNKAGRLLQKRILAALISGGLLLLPSCGYTLPSGGKNFCISAADAVGICGKRRRYYYFGRYSS